MWSDQLKWTVHTSSLSVAMASIAYLITVSMWHLFQDNVYFP